jgi:nickel-dependent lactate racemase
LTADFVMGIGGIYPNNTAGFGGGAKLALGVLDVRVISQLHRKHKGMGWGTSGPANNFRKDLDEIAGMIGLNTLITAHVNADRQLVRVRCGDFRQYYQEEVSFARQAFVAPKPEAADVVISNAFPNDLSLTFIHMKGVYPLRHAALTASRIILGSCAEGEGFHGVYPIVRMPFLHEHRDRLRRISLLTPSEISAKITAKLRAKLAGNGQVPTRHGVPSAVAAQTPEKHKNPIWFYRTGSYPSALPPAVRGMRVVHQWQQILDTVRREQAGRSRLQVVVYPCAPLQIIE